MRNFQGIILYEFEHIGRFSNLHQCTFTCCLLRKKIILPRQVIFCILCLCVRLYLMPYLCDLFFIIIYIFITINHIILSLKQTQLFFCPFLSKAQHQGVLLTFCFIFCHFQSDVVYKRIANKKKRASTMHFQNKLEYAYKDKKKIRIIQFSFISNTFRSKTRLSKTLRLNFCYLKIISSST